MPNKQLKRGTRALPSKFRRRNLSVCDQSCSDLLRNATTTPANPASATAIWVAIEGFTRFYRFALDRIQAARTNTKFGQDLRWRRRAVLGAKPEGTDNGPLTALEDAVWTDC
jgi:hypothetical protein